MSHATVQSHPLCFTLLGNATFSTLSGIAFLVAAPGLAKFAGMAHPNILRIIGAGLLLFAADLIFTALRGIKPAKVLIFIAGDFAWVIGTILLLTLAPQALSPQGRWAAGAIAAVVLVFGLLQDIFLFRALDKTHAVRVKVPLDASDEQAWRVISDFAGIDRIHPAVRKVTLVGETQSGPGAVRICEFTDGSSLREEVTQWRDGESLAVRLSDHNQPFLSATNALSVARGSDGRTELNMEMNYVMKYGPAGWLLGLLLKPIAARRLKSVLRGFAGAIEG